MMKHLRPLLPATLAMLIALIAGFARADDGRAARRALYRRGAMLWPVYCAQCHKPRPGSEFPPEQWSVIIMHMRSRAILSGEDARAILTYLQAR
jgi:mono/diheme cytochrome c family protein